MERKVVVKDKNIQDRIDILYNIVNIIYDNFIDKIIENTIRKIDTDDVHEIYGFTISRTVYSVDAQLGYMIQHIIEYLGNNHFQDDINIRELYEWITDKRFYKVDIATEYENDGTIYIYKSAHRELDDILTRFYGTPNKKMFLKEYYRYLVNKALNSCISGNNTTEEKKEEMTMGKEIGKVDILGTEYTITKKKFDDDSSTDGYIDWTDKTITVYDYDNYQFGDEVTLHDKKELMNQALRHEIIHAFLYESGLGDNWEHKAIGQEETVVDWIAYQFNKIKAVYEELGI